MTLDDLFAPSTFNNAVALRTIIEGIAMVDPEFPEEHKQEFEKLVTMLVTRATAIAGLVGNEKQDNGAKQLISQVGWLVGNAIATGRLIGLAGGDV